MNNVKTDTVKTGLSRWFVFLVYVSKFGETISKVQHRSLQRPVDFNENTFAHAEYVRKIIQLNKDLVEECHADTDVVLISQQEACYEFSKSIKLWKYDMYTESGILSLQTVFNPEKQTIFNPEDKTEVKTKTVLVVNPKKSRAKDKP